MSRITLDKMYMKIAQVVASRSSCDRRKVGCIIVKNNQILSEGYNGTPHGWYTNNCEDEDGETKDCVIHAEANAIAKAASSSISCRDADMFCTLQPCYECAKLIVQSNIERVVYDKIYRDTRPIDYMRECGIRVQKYDR